MLGTGRRRLRHAARGSRVLVVAARPLERPHQRRALCSPRRRDGGAARLDARRSSRARPSAVPTTPGSADGSPPGRTASASPCARSCRRGGQRATRAGRRRSGGSTGEPRVAGGRGCAVDAVVRHRRRSRRTARGPQSVARPSVPRRRSERRRARSAAWAAPAVAVVRTSAALEAPCSADVLFGHVDSLDRYPDWMALVHAAVREPAADGQRPAWSVELRTRVGPLARSKRLRMVRTVLEPGRTARFERQETDGRSHSGWVLTASVEPAPHGSRLTMDLEYGGSLWTGGVLQRILDDEIRRGSQRLIELVSQRPTH